MLSLHISQTSAPLAKREPVLLHDTCDVAVSLLEAGQLNTFK